MKIKLLLGPIFLAGVLTAQVGIKEKVSTETLHVKGTIRVVELPENGATNVITTNPDGTESSGKDQMFDAINTVLADDNGVLGIITGIPGQGAAPPEAVSWKVQPKGGIGGWPNPHNFSDSRDIKSGCLELKADPTNRLGVSGVYLYAKLDAQCGDKTYIILKGRRDSSFVRGDLYRRMEITKNGWSLIEGFDVITQDSPIQTVEIAMPYLKKYYKAMLSANNGGNPSGPNTNGNWPQISIYLDELY